MALVNLENKKQIIIIAFAIGAGIVASVLVGGYVQSNVNEETRKLAHQYEKAQAQKEQQYNDQINALNQKIGDVEMRATKAAEAAAKSLEAQKVAAQAIVAKKKPSLAKLTPAGKRALTVRLDSLAAVGGLLNPGDFVDVIAKLEMPSSKLGVKEKVIAMIFQNLQVLAVNTNLDEPGAYDIQQRETALKVTFAVDPQEAGLLAFADQNGKIDLALRTPTEKGRTMTSMANWSTLAEYVLENSGADIQSLLELPEENQALNIETENVSEAKPYIQIYRGGREL